MNGARRNPRDFWEKGRGTGAGAPRPLGGVPSGAPRAARPSRLAVPDEPRPTGPPPRVGGAVAALVVSLLTLAVPILGISLGFWFFVLVTNVPGIGFGIAALTKIPDEAAVERFLRYTWACNLAYVVLSVVFLVPVMVLALMMMMAGF
ncbi:hypothetical protein [Nocardiopsis aegyptia]|uniref:Uncharacterized protein n=1 Tax=Nocardiopsis aegyptia TaxID=220378 RepID=A0A7Z0EPM8_9ACTN|nr:hypothetical protein [Nocardiopsis aegyptia]NYJ35975.1 hypothetical protein [Nocardiopsis aegyptia]